MNIKIHLEDFTGGKKIKNLKDRKRPSINCAETQVKLTAHNSEPRNKVRKENAVT
jgi:hypothetical protein